MKRVLTIPAALAACSLAAGMALAQQAGTLQLPPVPNDGGYRVWTPTSSSLASYYDDEVEEDAKKSDNGAAQPDCGCEPQCGCDSGCSSCDSGWGSCLGDCCLGDAWTLQSELNPCCNSPTYGGWFSFGYYNKNERLSFNRGDELSFNDNPNELNLDQAWFFVERAADASSCSADYGYRFDMMYGAQAHAAQAFGNPRALNGLNRGTWDASWDHGVYGWAIPQLYGEVGFNDWSVKVGHFFTPAGYEVVQATGNFFYTHTLTHYNSEPFTHTGVLGTYSGYDDVTFYTGWSLGWDTGFDQFDSGNIFLGGLTYNASEDVALTYIVTAGNLGWKSNGEGGFSGHFVGIFTLSENLQYVLQHDYLTTDEAFDNPALQIDDKSVSNYLFYSLNDCWKVGSRFEWWNSNQPTGLTQSYYDATLGLNYRPCANLVFRPEIRYDWTPGEDAFTAANNEFYNQWSFSVDAVLTY